MLKEVEITMEKVIELQSIPYLYNTLNSGFKSIVDGRQASRQRKERNKEHNEKEFVKHTLKRNYNLEIDYKNWMIEIKFMRNK